MFANKTPVWTRSNTDKMMGLSNINASTHNPYRRTSACKPRTCILSLSLFQDVVFMETFVFTLNLEQLRGCALVLRLQTHTPRKRTQGECVLSLRTLASQETEHWLDLSPPCKTHVSPSLSRRPHPSRIPTYSRWRVLKRQAFLSSHVQNNFRAHKRLPPLFVHFNATFRYHY